MSEDVIKKTKAYTNTLKDRFGVKLRKSFSSKEEIKDAITKHIACQEDALKKLLVFIDNNDNKDKICATMNNSEMNDQDALIKSKTSGEARREYIKVNSDFSSCESILCEKVYYVNIFGRHYESLPECLEENTYDCDTKCDSAEYHSPMSEEELYKVLVDGVFTDEGRTAAEHYRDLCDGVIDDGKDGYKVVFETTLEAICVNCMGTANEHLPEQIPAQHGEL